MAESSSSKHAASSSTAPPPQQSSDGSCIATEAVTTQPAPQLATTVDERAQDQHHHDLEKQCTRGTIAPHHEGDHTAAAILAHPDGHDGDSARSSLNTDRDPEKGGNDTGLSTPHGITSSPAQSTRALTIIEDENFYPEGGLEAWLVVFGCWCSLLAALGVMNTLASFQANIHRNQLKGYTEGQIGWIFSVYAALSFGLGVFVGPIFDKFGARALMITGSVGVVVGMMLMSVCTEYYHFMLTFGVLMGSCTSFIFSPSVAAIGHWFKARRGLATGVGTTGGALGGIFWPLVMQYLIPQIGWGWTMRTLGFIYTLLLAIGCCLVKTRLPPDSNASAKPDMSILANIPFGFTVAAIYLLEWALFVPITYISSYALSRGFSEAFSYQCLIILNIGSVFGRWLPGFYADILGPFNTMLLTTALCVITVLCIWLPAGSTMPGLIVFNLLFGFASGSNIGLTPVCVGKLCRTEELGKHYATCYTIVAVGCLTGVPIVGEIIQRNGGEYWGLITFTGCCYGAALVSFAIVRVYKVGWGWREKY